MGVECKITCNKIAYNMSSNKQESSSQVKQIYDELIQEYDYHIKIRNQRQLKTEQSADKDPRCRHRNKEQRVWRSKQQIRK